MTSNVLKLVAEKCSQYFVVPMQTDPVIILSVIWPRPQTLVHAYHAGEDRFPCVTCRNT